MKYFHAYKNESWLQYVNNKIQLFRMHSRKRARLHRTFDNPLEYLFHSISFTCKRHLSPTEQQANRKKNLENKTKSMHTYTKKRIRLFILSHRLQFSTVFYRQVEKRCFTRFFSDLFEFFFYFINDQNTISNGKISLKVHRNFQ